MAIGSLTCHSPTRPLPSHSEPPSASSLASPDRTLCLKAPFHSSSVRRSPVRPRRLALEILPCQCSLTGPLWGESESLSPALPGASGAFHHPSIYSLFKSGAPGQLLGGREGPQAGNAGSVTCLGKGWDFPGRLLWPVIPSFIISIPDLRAPVLGLTLPLTLHADLGNGAR